MNCLFKSSKSSSSKRISILIQGANGKLGSLITKHALQNPKLLVNILVRDPSQNKEFASQVEKAGGRVIKGDLSDISSLKDVTKGIHTVITSLGRAGESTIADGQIALIDDSVKNGVKRFVPSFFGMDHSRFTREENLATFVTAPKVKVQEYLKTAKIADLTFSNGNIAEPMFFILGQGRSYWGDDNLKQDLTSYDNLARVIVAAVARPELTGMINYKGGSYTIKEIQDTYNKVRGTNVELKRAGSLEDLKKLIEVKRKEGDVQTAGILTIVSMMYDQRSKFIETNNKDFPEVKATSLEEILRENLNLTL